MRERCDSQGNKAATHSPRSHNPHRDVTGLSTNHTASILSFSFFFSLFLRLSSLSSSVILWVRTADLRTSNPHLGREIWTELLTQKENPRLTSRECRVNNQMCAGFDITTTSSIRRPILSGAVVGAAQQMPAYPATTTLIGYH